MASSALRAQGNDSHSLVGHQESSLQHKTGSGLTFPDMRHGLMSHPPSLQSPPLLPASSHCYQPLHIAAIHLPSFWSPPSPPAAPHGCRMPPSLQPPPTPVPNRAVALGDGGRARPLRGAAEQSTARGFTAAPAEERDGMGWGGTGRRSCRQPRRPRARSFLLSLRAGNSPSLAFFFLARVPPSLPRNDSSFFILCGRSVGERRGAADIGSAGGPARPCPIPPGVCGARGAEPSTGSAESPARASGASPRCALAALGAGWERCGHSALPRPGSPREAGAGRASDTPGGGHRAHPSSTCGRAGEPLLRGTWCAGHTRVPGKMGKKHRGKTTPPVPAQPDRGGVRLEGTQRSNLK